MRNKFISIFSFFISIYFLADLCIYFYYKDQQTVEKIDWVIRVANFTNEEIPDNLISTYEDVFPNSLDNNIYPDLLWITFAKRDNGFYPQIDLAYKISQSSGFKIISIANQLDNRLTHKQCIYAYLEHVDFSNNIHGITQAAFHYYNKRLKELTKLESIELIIMTKNPFYYDKIRHPERLKREVEKITGSHRGVAQ